MGMGMGEKTGYEQLRQQRLEANKRQMEALGISSLSKDLQKNSLKATLSTECKSISKLKIPLDLIERRQSSRIALIPAPSYREDSSDIGFLRLRRGSSATAAIKRNFFSDPARAKAAEMAESVKTENPSFIKIMQPSHVYSVFWLGLPQGFCRGHMPKKDTYFYLEDEKGKEWESLYLANKTGLSAGWKRFAVEHELQAGDALVYELVAQNRLKIQIFRAESFENASQEKEKDPVSSKKAKKSKKVKKAKKSKKS